MDLTELNLSPVLETPVRAPAPGGPPNRVYAGSGHEVKTVMVAGKVLIRDGEVLVSGEAAVRAEAQVRAEEVARRVTADPVHKGMALLQPMQEGQLQALLIDIHLAQICGILVSEGTMDTITITLPDECLSRLKDRAADLGIAVEELGRLSVEELFAKLGEAFEQAIGQALDKNKDLYERLGRHRGFGSARGLVSVADDFDAPLYLTVRDLRQAEIIGLWKDRTDIDDSSLFARQLREQAQERGDIS